MSYEAINWAFSQKVKSGPRFVLVALANYADENNSCYPSYKKLHEKTGIAVKTIGTHLKHLEAAGLISRTQQRYDDGNFSSHRYQLHLDADYTIPADLGIQTVSKPRGKSFEKVPSANLATGSPSAKLGSTVCKIGNNRLLNLHDNNPQVNPHKNPQGKKAVSDHFEELWKTINSRLVKSRQGEKQRAKNLFTRKAKEIDPEQLSTAIVAFYADPAVNKDGYRFAPAIAVCLSKERYTGYLGSAPSVPASVMKKLYERRDAGEITQDDVDRLASEYVGRAA